MCKPYILVQGQENQIQCWYQVNISPHKDVAELGIGFSGVVGETHLVEKRHLGTILLEPQDKFQSG